MQQLLPVPAAEPDLDALYATPAAPTTRLGLVGSVDGRAALHGVSAGLSTPSDRQVFRLLRSLADVVLVGAGTARVEGYLPVTVSDERARARLGRGQRATPAVAVVSRGAGLPPGHPLLTEGAGTILLRVGDTRGCPPAPGVVEVVDVPRLEEGLDALRDRGLLQVLCEGGPALAADLVAGGLVHELCLTTSPLLVGGPGPGLLTGLPEGRRGLELAHLLHGDGSLLARWLLAPDVAAAPVG